MEYFTKNTNCFTWTDDDWCYDDVDVSAKFKGDVLGIHVKNGDDYLTIVGYDGHTTYQIPKHCIEKAMFTEAKLFKKGSIVLIFNETIPGHDCDSYYLDFRKTPDTFYILFGILRENGIEVIV